ncbi:MAG TPA: hypothetical protein VF316_22810, partial [Polyangiaceae bacterium]
VPPPGSTIAAMTSRLSDPAFAEEATSPALDVRKELAALHAERVSRELGDEPTLPALDLSKEIAAIKKLKDPPKDP